LGANSSDHRSKLLNPCSPDSRTIRQEFKQFVGVRFQNYALGFRFVASPRELEIITSNDMFGHVALAIGDTDALTFADLLAPALIPEVHWSVDHLLEFECEIRESAAKWSHFLASMDDDGFGLAVL